MGRLRLFSVVGLVGAAVLLTTSASAAGWWASPVSALEVLRAFGSTYVDSLGRSCTHRGLDVAGQAGAQVSSPAAGEVSFAGKVPADGGGTTWAVTIRVADGLDVSLLPLESIAVTAGEQVEAGVRLGTLAASGDDSVAAPHVHVGVRRNGVYLDPMGYFAMPTASAAESPKAAAAPEAAAEPLAPAVASVAAPASVGDPVPQPRPLGAPAPVAVSAPAMAPVPAAALLDSSARADVPESTGPASQATAIGTPVGVTPAEPEVSATRGPAGRWVSARRLGPIPIPGPALGVIAMALAATLPVAVTLRRRLEGTTT
jgi:hypothetical protein